LEISIGIIVSVYITKYNFSVFVTVFVVLLDLKSCMPLVYLVVRSMK